MNREPDNHNSDADVIEEHASRLVGSHRPWRDMKEAYGRFSTAQRLTVYLFAVVVIAVLMLTGALARQFDIDASYIERVTNNGQVGTLREQDLGTLEVIRRGRVVLSEGHTLFLGLSDAGAAFVQKASGREVTLKRFAPTPGFGREMGDFLCIEGRCIKAGGWASELWTGASGEDE